MIITSLFRGRPRPPGRRLRIFSLVTGFTVLTCLHGAAQPEAPRPPAKLRFLFLDETAGAYSLKVNESFKQIISAPYTISSPIVPTGSDRLDIYKTNPVPDPITGKNKRVKVASITPPTNTTSALVILTPRRVAVDSDAAPVYDVEFIDSDPQAYPIGTLRVLNRGTAAMAAQIGSENLIAEPGATKIIKPSTDTHFRLRTKVATQTPGGWKLLDNNVTILKANNRLTGVLLFSPSGMRHIYDESTIYDRGAPPPGHVWLMYSDPP